MIYKGSRYTNTEVYHRNEIEVFKRRELFDYNVKNAQIHTFIQGENLSRLAQQYYEDTQLWWCILEANPQYRCPLDIKYGDKLIIPHRDEVLKIYE